MPLRNDHGNDHGILDKRKSLKNGLFKPFLRL